MPTPSNISLDLAYMEYQTLLREYQEAKRTYLVDDSKENWDRLQEGTRELKRHCDLTEIRRRTAI